jgi:hypothetical protein
MRHFVASALATLALTGSLLVPGTARADLSACGNIDIEAEAQCNQVATAQCGATCETLSFEAACYAKGYVQCNASCNLDAEVNCAASCDLGKCEATCNVKPPEFECSADCAVNCNGSCSGECDAECNGDSGCKSRCMGSCKATCSGQCNASCTGTPGSATCKAKCQASCSASCKAKANIGCQASCQTSELHAGCEASLKGGCKVKCEAPDGLVECKGTYVDNNGNAQKCLDAIENWKASIHLSATGSANCSNGVCTAEGAASCSCGTAPGSNTLADASALFGVGALGIGAFLRRRRLNA